MKPDRASLALVLLLGISSGILFWQARFDTAGTPEALQRRFEGGERPLFSVSPAEIRGGREARELWDPAFALPRLQDFPHEEIRALYSYAKNCLPSAWLSPKKRFAPLEKAWIWHRHRCGALKSLPADFFENAPFMHPSGASYVRLADLSARFPSLQHVLEDATLSISRLSAGELRAILEGQRLVLGGKHAWIVHENGEVRAYPRASWDRFAARESLSPSGWRIWGLAGLSFGAFVTALAAVLIVSLRRIRQRKQEDERRLFVLQMLTHELRTPAASLRLSLEELRREFDHLPEGSQRAFLRMCDELQRLGRITEASKNYLGTSPEGRGQGLRFREDSLPSCNDYFAELRERISPELDFSPLATDRGLKCDPYWLELCVKNLVDNALAHGQAPVRLVLSEERRRLRIAVTDQGSAALEDLSELTRPFSKGKRSRGLGLGLSIVQRAVSGMGGELAIQSAPTTFSILLKAGG
ncbi:MAG: HAMP domain-containing histidine kinase [Oligoflexia bacterium]|nr:HAMP domain-containing histidine kinase [Oligoflexia bacterium]